VTTYSGYRRNEMAHPVRHFEIQTRNPDKVQKFYKDLFDWKIQVFPNMNGYGMVDSGTPGQGIGFGIGGILPGAHQMVTFYIEVDNAQSYMEKAVKLGGKVIMPPMTMPGMGDYGLFADPDGNVIGVFKDERAAQRPS
jgi:hypothetical protein